MKAKSRLGQFYTTNYSYILQGMSVPNNVETIVEPFVGNGDLLKILPVENKYTLELYDIDPVQNELIITKRDTLLNPPCYKNKFVLTNPPYLARNKNTYKTLYNKYKTDDLYKCFLLSLLDSESKDDSTTGILILPLNFICSIRKADVALRERFLSQFEIIRLNIFEEKVFADTGYTVCSFQFQARTENSDWNIPTHVYPNTKIINIELNRNNNYTIGGEIYQLPMNKNIVIERATRLNTEKKITNILLKCIDDNNDSQLGFSMVVNNKKFIDNTDKLSARSYASLVINKELSLQEQTVLVKKMNEFITEKRLCYNSLFLTNYRESNRKRISFELGFRICNYVYNFL